MSSDVAAGEKAPATFGGLRAGQAYFYAVIVLGLSLLTLSTALHPAFGHLVTPLFWLLALVGVCTEVFAVPLPRGGHLSPAFAIIFACLIMLGLVPTLHLIILIATASSLAIRRRTSWLVAFNISQLTLTYTLAHLVLCVGASGHRLDFFSGNSFAWMYEVGGGNLFAFDALIWVFAAMVTQLFVNVLLVNSYIALEKHVSIWKVIWEDDRWELLFTLGLFPLAILMVELHRRMGVLGAAMVLVPFVVSSIVLLLYIKMRQTSAALRAAHAELEIIHDITQRIGSHIDLPSTLRLIGGAIAAHLGDSEVRIYLRQEGTECYLPQRIGDRDPDGLASVVTGQGVLGRWVRSGGVLSLSSPETIAAEEDPSFQGMASVLGALIRQDDRVLGLVVVLSPVRDAFDSSDENLLEIIGSQAAVAVKNALLYQTTQQLAITDGLTGVYNRAYFQRQLEAEFRRAPRFGYPISLILIDVDHFKAFNDAHGHLLGDQALRAVAQILRESTRETDVVARYGGEEFAVILPETATEQALEVAERIRANISGHTFWGRGQTPVNVTASIGVVGKQASETRPESLVDLADTALYHAKHSGRDRISAITPVQDRPFVYLESRRDPEASVRRRLPARATVKLDAVAWASHLSDAVDALAALAFEKLEALDLAPVPDEAVAWHDFLRQGIDGLIQRVSPQTSARPSLDTVTEPGGDLRGRMHALIQRGMTLTQSESFIVTLTRSLAQHVQQAPFSPAERLIVLAEVEQFSDALQIALSQIWHSFYERSSEHLVRLHELEETLAQLDELDEILNVGVEALGSSQVSERASLVTLGAPDWKILASPASPFTERLDIAPFVAHAWPGRSFESTQPILFRAADESLPQAIRDSLSARDLDVVLVVPMVHQGEAIGLGLVVPGAGAEQDPALTRYSRMVAGLTAAAIGRLEHASERTDWMLHGLVALAEAIEGTDSTDRVQTDRLVDLTLRLAQSLQVAPPDLGSLRLAAMLRDLGRLALPGETDSRGRSLTDDERAAIRTQPEIAARLLDPIEALRGVVPVVRHHRERWDGSGYPQGLHGEQIPRLARILAVAETFEALIHERSYRPGTTAELAVREMRESGRFDPEVIGVLEGLVLAGSVR